MDRRKFLETAGALAIVPAAIASSPDKELGKQMSQDEVNRAPPGVPVINFDDENHTVHNFEEIVEGKTIKEATDITGPMYLAFLKREDHIVSPFPTQGAFWGLVHVEARELYSRFCMGIVHHTPESHSVNHRRPNFVYYKEA